MRYHNPEIHYFRLLKEYLLTNLIEPSTDTLKKVFKDLLDHIVTNDSNVTRREEQLDQLCNLILLKLQSDLKGRLSANNSSLDFFPQSTQDVTGDKIRRDFQRLVNLHPEVFLYTQEKELRLTNASIHRCVTELYRLRLIGVSAETISTAFQVLRTAALRQKEGQYFTPQPVIQAAIKLMEIQWDDLIIDPACGTGGFLIECLRININPTNMVPRPLAEKLWGSTTSGLQAWDVITPNRASNNIGEFAMLLPGEEGIVLTKEMFVIRTSPDLDLAWNPFYLMWAFCLKAVRRQWRRVVLMQTNREDVGSRYREIRLPVPKSQEYSHAVSSAFQDFFKSIAESKQNFLSSIESSRFSYIPNIMRVASIVEDADGEEIEYQDEL